MDNALSTLPEGSEEAAKYLQEASQRSNECFLCGQRATGHERAPTMASPTGRRDQLASSSTHGHQQEATSTIPQRPGHSRATPRQPPLNDSQISTACTKNACVTWHPPPSPPQHPEALTCHIPNTLSTNEPNTSSSTCNTVHVGNRLSCNLMFWRQIGASNFVLSVVEHGYSLPFGTSSDRLFFVTRRRL